VTDIGLGSWPARRARIDPAAIALRQGPRALSYLDLARRVDTLAGSLATLGIGRGGKIGYLGPNDIATFETMFAAGRLGAVFVPLNIRLAAAEITALLADCGARVLVFGPETAALAAAAAPGSPVTDLIALDPATGGLDYQALATPPPGSPPEATWPGGGRAGRELAEVGLDDPAVLLYTSGTTGRPKGALLTHGNITFNTVNQLATTDVLASDVVLCSAPLFHVAGLGQVTLPTLFKGGTLVALPRFEPAAVLRLIPELGVTAFPAVPTMLQMLADDPGFAAADLSSLRYIVYGGSPVLARVARAWADRGVSLLQGYGMTEAAPGVLLSAPAGAAGRVLSAGVPQFFTDLALLGPDGITAPPGTGELLARGPNVFPGYLNRPAESAAALAGGWLHTGDVVRMDPDGWGYVVGRVKDMIISGGENIYPAEVESAIAEMPGVADCAVVGVPDEQWGEVGFAVVVPRDGAAVDPAAVRAQLAPRLARYKIPKYIRIAGQLPRTSTGKVIKAALREMAAGEVRPGGAATGGEAAPGAAG
jgi:fatty-acyl-CoA synthase